MGTFSILNNISALNGQHQLNVNSVNLNRTLNRMASGMRINSGADDAAGLQIADTLRANVYALNQAVRNAQDGLSFLQIADGALSEITNMLTRMVTLAEEGANEPIDDRGRLALNNEFQELQAEIGRLALQTNFNGTHLFKMGRSFGDTLDLFVGDISGNSSISVVMGYVDVLKAAFIDTNGNTINKWDGKSTVDKDAPRMDEVLKIAQFAASLAVAEATKVWGTATTLPPIFTGTTGLQAAIANASTSTNPGQDYYEAISKIKEVANYQEGHPLYEAKLVATAKRALAVFEGVFDGRDKIVGFKRDSEALTPSLATVNLLTHATSAAALTGIRDALNEISNMRGTIGAGMNRLQAGISVMQTQSRNTLSAESSIRDANMAEEITSMTRYQILAQTGIAALAHSNANSQIVLRLLQQ